MNNDVLYLHRSLGGKIETRSKMAIRTRRVLSLLYTPGVSQVVRHIEHHPRSVRNLTIKKNTVAVISDGSAVLGMGNVGPLAALPVMEGKCAIFKEFAGINAFPLCLGTQNTEEIINTIINIAPVFGGINLEDISAPRCFEIEEKLQKLLDIPVMHDDQHATAIVVLAGLINAAKAVKKELKSCKVVVNGAGAAGTAIVRLLKFYGINHLFIVDSKGIICTERKDLDEYKVKLLQIINPQNISGSLLTAAKGADILIGVSVKNVFNKDVIRQMNRNPIVFALANPDPEISEREARSLGVSVYANGRSDCRNQINNALVFPGFFRGLLAGRVTKITDALKLRAALALSALIKNPPKNNFIPSILDRRVVTAISDSLA